MTKYIEQLKNRFEEFWFGLWPSFEGRDGMRDKAFEWFEQAHLSYKESLIEKIKTKKGKYGITELRKMDFDDIIEDILKIISE